MHNFSQSLQFFYLTPPSPFPRTIFLLDPQRSMIYLTRLALFDIDPTVVKFGVYFHIQFVKELLGVHCKTSNDACKAESGRIPLKGKILFSCFQYLEHILSLEGSLVKDIFET